MQLGERLAAIAALTPRGARLADIGTDHAYLPVYLVESDIVSQAIATDVHEGPYRSALATVAAALLTEKIAVRFGDGLAVLEPGEVDTLVLAGMGGNTILMILEAHIAVTSLVTRLILQPMVAAGAVRRWLVANGWHIVDEALVREEDMLYEIIVAESGKGSIDDPILYDIGPILWGKRPLLLKSHIEGLIGQSQRVLTAMSGSPMARNTIKFREYARKISQLEEKNACL